MGVLQIVVWGLEVGGRMEIGWCGAWLGRGVELSLLETVFGGKPGVCPWF